MYNFFYLKLSSELFLNSFLYKWPVYKSGKLSLTSIELIKEREREKENGSESIFFFLLHINSDKDINNLFFIKCYKYSNNLYFYFVYRAT